MILYVINLSLSQTLSLSQSDKKQSVLKRERETLFYARVRVVCFVYIKVWVACTWGNN